MHAFTPGEIRLRTASDVDVPAIIGTLRANLADRSLFQRTAADVRRRIDEFMVAVSSDEVVGCSCLHLCRCDLAELSTVVIRPELQGRGIGGMLVAASLAHANRIGCARVWLGTLKPRYFARYGFEVISRWDLPLPVLLQKVPGIFHQPPARWSAALLGKLVYMQRFRSS